MTQGNIISFILSFLSITLTTVSTTIIIESPRFPEPVEYDCDKVKFPQEIYVTCICLEGIWSLSVSQINEPPSWKILGGRTASNVTTTKTKFKCYHVGEWVSRVQRISHFIYKPSLKKLQHNSNKFLVTNNEDWEVRIMNLECSQMKKVCLPSHGSSFYCIYNLNQIEDSQFKISQVEEDAFKMGCATDSIILDAQECGTMFPKRSSSETTLATCSLIPPTAVKDREKREVKKKPLDEYFIKLFEEDQVDPELLKNRKGHPDMMTSVVDYIKLAVAQRLEAAEGGKSKSKKKSQNSKLTPAQSLLRLCKDVAQQSCSALNGDTYNIALNSFLTQQLQRNHLKEPYISYTVYQRTFQALERCRAEARPFMFFPNVTFDGYCETQLPLFTTHTIKLIGQNVTIADMPLYAYGDVRRFDPLIETVWKMFVTAHSICFRFFNEYFNDHHTFTIAMIPFFTNKIQDIWMLEKPPPPGAGDSTNKDPETTPNYKTTIVWYGDLLGNAGKLMEDIDHCYQAARIPMGNNPTEYYPWFLKRPPKDTTNEWMQRKKRSLPNTDNNTSATNVKDAGENLARTRGSCDGKFV